MKKNILVIGGSYFVGRVFSMYASKGEKLALHVVNRGRYKMNLTGVSEYRCDRHDTNMLPRIIPDIAYDAVVDFCGYNPGEISSIINALPGRVRQYLFISTSSVYASAGMKKEGDRTIAPAENQAGPETEYLYNKVRLERELKDECNISGIPYTIVRPTFIYGPYNYAPRESYFIKNILKGIPVPEPTDAHSRFSMIYVLDIARALELFVGNNNAFNEVFNLAGVEQVTYPYLYSELERCNGAPFAKTPVTVSQVEVDNIVLPFPLEVDDLCSGEKMTKYFGFKYTSFPEGMDKTFAAFKSVYS